ncbi:MAG: GYF domain-containing protein [Kiritimatiellaeota bacterium]|nr:GYF domain-containing protein [Kiritimatiellota bacterium]
MNWFLKKTDNTVYGPVTLAVLQHWAADGRIAPGDLLSPDQQTWQPAEELPELDMVWHVELQDGSFYGPIHLLATGDLVRDGAVAPTARVANQKTGREHALNEALLLTVLEQNAQLGGAAEELRQQLQVAAEGADAPPAAVAEPAAAPVSPPVESGPLPGTWREITAQKETWEKAALKWQHLYTDAQARAERREQELKAHIAKLRREELAARIALEHAQNRLAHLEQLNEQIQLATQGKTDLELLIIQRAALMEAYDGLAQRCDILMSRLAEKTAEFDELNAARMRIEQEAGERIQQRDAQVIQERDEADRARKRALMIEADYLQLLRAYRELNDHYIRLRQKFPAPRERPPDNSAAAALVAAPPV